MMGQLSRQTIGGQFLESRNHFFKSFGCGFLIFFFNFCGLFDVLFRSTSLQGCLYAALQVVIKNEIKTILSILFADT